MLLNLLMFFSKVIILIRGSRYITIKRTRKKVKLSQKYTIICNYISLSVICLLPMSYHNILNIILDAPVIISNHKGRLEHINVMNINTSSGQ